MSEAVTQIQTLVRSMVRNRSFFRNDSKAALMIEEHLRGAEVDPREVDYGGFSRKMNGSRLWTVADIIALQAITGSTRITQAIEQAGRQDDEEAESELPALRHAAAIVREVADSGRGDSDTEDQLLDLAQQVNEALRTVRRRADPVELNARRSRA